jgi:hypothetical protein
MFLIFLLDIMKKCGSLGKVTGEQELLGWASL